MGESIEHRAPMGPRFANQVRSPSVWVGDNQGRLKVVASLGGRNDGMSDDANDGMEKQRNLRRIHQRITQKSCGYSLEKTMKLTVETMRRWALHAAGRL